ncbi:Uncharacterised protein [Shewanella baltica]|uniref:hypothetical protein n=1 Tax=Shewanella TaxID=22 RepID=UPI000CA14775|nr:MULTISPECIES: hypothetical protein [Shewanella]AUD59552.1 hypothetical protein AYJ58_08640 [Shewanella sp. Pdp11]VEF25114.1 Uncharacterised protein [Shewanella baltica]
MEHSTFIHVNQLKTFSPRNEHCKVVLLADIKLNDQTSIELLFTRYIYLHLNIDGHVLGVSISQSIFEEHPEFSSQFLNDLEMMQLLLMYVDDITNFCQLFAAEFEYVLGYHPTVYFEAAEQYWEKQIIEVQSNAPQ